MGCLRVDVCAFHAILSHETSETSHTLNKRVEKGAIGKRVYSRVIGKWCLEMLRKPLEVMSKFLEFGVGHSATASKGNTDVTWGRS